MGPPTVAQYCLQRVSQLGIDRIFGVPGDYAFSIDGAAEHVPGLSWVGCANELNAAYAADGYARIRGAALLSTTYGVGELSAINGVMGSKAHRLPVFHIVGQPSERIQKLGLPTHHNLGDTVYDRFEPLSAAAACVTANLTPENCVEELENVIRKALKKSMPAYIVISELHGFMPIMGIPITGKPIAEIKRQISIPKELDAAVTGILSRLESAEYPVAIMTNLVSRYGAREIAMEFVSKSNIPTAITPYEKGAIDESMPQYVGICSGVVSSPPELNEYIANKADIIIDIGGIVNTEMNTGFWTADYRTEKMITIGDDWVRMGDQVFVGVAIDDVLRLLSEKVTPRTESHGLKPGQMPSTGSPSDAITSPSFYPRFQRCLMPGDTVVIETGTCMTFLDNMLLPSGVTAESQSLWGSIGWATPAAFGIALAKKSGRTLMVTGDGSHQLTLNELGPMARYGAKLVIFVLNNGIFGIEDVLSERGHPYDDLAPVKYHLLPSAFGCDGWLVAKVGSIQELDEIFEKIQGHDGAAYIEVKIPPEESQPMRSSFVDRAYKLRTPNPEKL